MYIYIHGIVWIYPDIKVIESICRGGEFFGNATSGCHHAGHRPGERPEFYWCGMDLDYEHVGKA